MGQAVSRSSLRAKTLEMPTTWSLRLATAPAITVPSVACPASTVVAESFSSSGWKRSAFPWALSHACAQVCRAGAVSTALQGTSDVMAGALAGRWIHWGSNRMWKPGAVRSRSAKLCLRGAPGGGADGGGGGGGGGATLG